MKKRDRELGMGRAISRRDLLNGIGIAVTGSVVFPWACADRPKASPGTPAVAAMPPPAGSYYPPTRTGLRGSHEGSYEVAHGLREGKTWPDAGLTAETYDLIVVGGGLSGLSAAWFYRQEAGPDARILILDNHDDFGGHAKRNEFHYNDQMLLAFGGTINIEDFNQYGRGARRLFRSLGIDVDRYSEFTDPDLYSSLGMGRGVFFDRETFGTDRLVVDRKGESWPEFLARAPLSEPARRDIGRLMENEIDYLPELSQKKKREFLQSVSYQDYLLETVGVHPDALPFFRARATYWAVGIDALSAWAAVESGYPGVTALGFGDDEDEPRYFSFPDGNSSIARLLVRSLNPRVAPESTAGEGMEEIVTARFDYSRLDQADAPVRVRLNSTAIHVGHVGEAETATEVEVAYVRDGRTERARAGHCVLACYHSMIPYLCPELPRHQREALGQSLKAPLVYTNVLLRDWTAFQKLGVRSISSPGSYHLGMRLSRPMTLGGYRSSHSPEDPTVLFMSRIPMTPGLTAQEQWRAGRLDLLTTPFETFERNIRDQLGRMLSDGGFDPARDIEAITVNRWPHGYSYGQDPETGQVAFVLDELPRERRPWLMARKTWGRIAIANGDGYPIAMTEAAIGQAHRAVGDLV